MLLEEIHSLLSGGPIESFRRAKFRDRSKYFDNLTGEVIARIWGLVMVRPAIMAGAADGIRTVVVAEANAAPGWLSGPPGRITNLTGAQ